MGSNTSTCSARLREEGMIVAAYDDEDKFSAASDTITSILGDMAQFMTSAPHTHAGTVDQSFGR